MPGGRPARALAAFLCAGGSGGSAPRWPPAPAPVVGWVVGGQMPTIGRPGGVRGGASAGPAGAKRRSRAERGRPPRWSEAAGYAGMGAGFARGRR